MRYEIAPTLTEQRTDILNDILNFSKYLKTLGHIHNGIIKIQAYGKIFKDVLKDIIKI